MKKAPFAMMAVMVLGMAAVFGLVACGGATAPSSISSSGVVDVGGGNVDDELFKKDVSDARMQVFQFKGKTLTVSGCYTIDATPGSVLQDGHFYTLVADVTYLNGGVAGYVDFPEVKQAKSCEEISPSVLQLSSIESSPYGLVLIGDYADGDILLNEQGNMAVWKDGAWIYEYDKTIKLDNARSACVRDGVAQAEVEAGIENGILSCADYFVLPHRAQ